MKNLREQMDVIVTRWTEMTEDGKGKGDPEFDACMAEYNALDCQRREEITQGEQEKRIVEDLNLAAGIRKMTEDLKAELKANEWPIRKPEDKPANPRGSFKWVSILISGGQLAQYLQYCAGGRTIATFPHDAGRGLWLEVNRLLKGTANDIGKSLPICGHSILRRVSHCLRRTRRLRHSLNCS
jgi:hypothetical protein